MASKETRIQYDPVTGKKIPPPVRPKPVRMTATKLTRASAVRSPPQSQGSGNPTEDELDALTDLLVKNLENSGDPDFFGKHPNNTCVIARCFVQDITVGHCTLVILQLLLVNTDVQLSLGFLSRIFAINEHRIDLSWSSNAIRTRSFDGRSISCSAKIRRLELE